MAAQINPLPPVNTAWVDPDGKPSLTFRTYFLTFDPFVRSLNPTIQVVSPSNANAKAAGVPVGGFYTSTADPHIVYVRTA